MQLPQKTPGPPPRSRGACRPRGGPLAPRAGVLAVPTNQIHQHLHLPVGLEPCSARPGQHWGRAGSHLAGPEQKLGLEWKHKHKNPKGGPRSQGDGAAAVRRHAAGGEDPSPRQRWSRAGAYDQNLSAHPAQPGRRVRGARTRRRSGACHQEKLPFPRAPSSALSERHRAGSACAQLRSMAWPRRATQPRGRGTSADSASKLRAPPQSRPL